MSKKNQRLLLLGVLGLLVLVLSSFAGISYTSQSGFCSSCHIMNSNYVSWEQSSHNKVDCLKCHAEPGIIGTLEVKVKGVKQVASTVFNLVDKPGKASVPNSICTSCHNQGNKELAAKLEKTKEERYKNRIHIGFDHVKHDKIETKCTLCHVGVGHSDKVDPKQVMAACQSCHTKSLLENKQAKVPKSNECNSCHTDVQEIIPKNHQPKEKWALAHGTAALKNIKDCNHCHQLNLVQGGAKLPAGEANAALNVSANVKSNQNFCLDCHKVVIPHQQNYLQVHAEEYKANPEVCNKCHQQGAKPAAGRRANNCLDCHKLPIPHPEGFAKNHGSLAKTDSSKCLYCHSGQNPVNPYAKYAAKNYCSDCHTKNSPHKGDWEDKHKAPALNNIASCSYCHAKPGTAMTLANYKQTQLCAKCHVSNPHPANWITGHGQAIQTKASTCVSCHKQQNFCSTCHSQ